MTKHHNFILLGTGGAFTTTVLGTLLEAGCAPRAYLHWGSVTPLADIELAGIEIEAPAALPPIAQLCRSQQIKTIANAQTDLHDLLEELKVDFLCCACWPRLIEHRVLELVSHAAMNLHPSLLPAYRGFDPIRAQLRAEERDLGVSLHLLSDQFDQGDLIAQALIAAGPAPSYQAIEHSSAKLGARLLMQAMADYGTAAWRPCPQIDPPISP